MIWPEVMVGDVCETGSGGTPSRANYDRYYHGTIPWVKSGELKDGLVEDTEEKITEEGLGESSAKLVKRDSVLIALYGATVGKTALLKIDATTNQAVCYLTPNRKILNSEYLWFVLRSKQKELLAQRVGGAQPNISQAIIRKTKIPLPSLSEQRRIVEILDQADTLQKKRVEADKIAERILPALFYKMFGDPVKNPKGFIKNRLGNLIKVKSGDSVPVKRLHPSDGFPVYGGNGINGYHTEYMLDGPVVIIGRVGQYCGSVHYSKQRCWITDNALFVYEQSKDIHPRYLVEALKVANLNQYAGRAGQPLVSGSRIYPVEILVPPMPIQLRFVGQIETLDALLSKARTSRENLEKLFSVLLHRAFSGDLTANWREAHMTELLKEMEEQAKELAKSGVSQ